jgi:hypothetical protein
MPPPGPRCSCSLCSFCLLPRSKRLDETRPRGSFISTKPLSTDPKPHLRRQVVLWGALARHVQKLATREAATMLLIPVALVIGGILALVLYLEKRSPPYRE